jgi:hypothetical protein
MDDAFISPDDPMPERTPSGQAGARSAAAYDAMAVTSDDAEGVVTGMGDDAHLDPTELALGGDPHVRAVAEAVSKLAASLEQKGEAGLRTSLEMTRFEAQLRAYCVGYLAGKRAEDEAS